MGNDEKPLWAIKLDLGIDEAELREQLSLAFDAIMCNENNGQLYLWSPEKRRSAEIGELKCPHITIGFRGEDREIAEKLVENKSAFKFSTIDFKQVGPHDPLFSVSLERAPVLSFSPILASTKEDKIEKAVAKLSL